MVLTQPALFVIGITLLSLVALTAASIYYVPRVLSIEGHGDDHETEAVETEESEPTAGRPA